MDQFRKNREKAKAEAMPQNESQTLAEILSDKKKGALFGELLKRDGDEELAKRIAGKNLEPYDISILDKYRTEFTEKMAQVEKVEEMLSEESLMGIAQNHPDFKKIITLVGTEKAIIVIKSQLRDMCFMDENGFNAIAKPIELHNDYIEGEYKETNEKVEKICKDMQITPEEYLSTLEIKDPQEKERKLKELSGRTYSGFKRAINIISLGKWAKNEGLQNLKDSETSIEDSLFELEEHKKNIGTALFISISDNENLRNAFSGELVGDKQVSKTEGRGFGDAKKEAPEKTFSEEDFNKDWEEYKKRNGYDSNPSYQEDMKDSFINEQVGKSKKNSQENKGFWASIFEILFENKIKNKRNTLK